MELSSLAGREALILYSPTPWLGEGREEELLGFVADMNELKLWNLNQKTLEAQSPDKQNKKNQGDLQRSLEPGQKSREGRRQANRISTSTEPRQGREVSLY